MKSGSFRPATIAARAAGAKDIATGGIVPAISPSTTYARDENYDLLMPENKYGRDQNATVRQFEELVRLLEGAAATCAFASGMAAVSALMRSVPNGGRIILQSGIYHGVTSFTQKFATRRNITMEQVNSSDLSELEAACCTKADLVWIEVPSNPWLKVTDISSAAKLAHACDAALCVDATAATPVLLQPLGLGADFVVHSATKAINGHSDVLGGVISCADPDHGMWRAVLEERLGAGAILGAFEAWLMLRGARTLPLRMERMCSNATDLARRLEQHKAIEAVFYPGLESHKSHALAKAQMHGGCGHLLSVMVNGGQETASRVVSKVKLFERATSLGGVESLIEHRHILEPQSGLPQNLLRLSIGIEDVEDLWDDLEYALSSER
ncbi:MAG: aminotransferase class I/II-fold pyridoxal phosphate-dependent enzyme [Pseudomonadota bacterium]